MIDYMGIAQDFIDSNKTIPNEILLHMNTGERQIIARIIELKDQLGKAVDNILPEKNLHLVKHRNPVKKKLRLNFKLLYAAVALVAVVIYFPISESIETRKVLREETSRFVDQLFERDGAIYILADLGITNDWFNSDITTEF